MDLKRLKAFLAIVETGTFAAAADELRSAQSTISASIGILERELSVELFDRSARTAVLTAAGRALVPEAKELLRREALTRRLVQDASTSLSGELRLGVISSVAPVPLPRVLQRFTAAHPQVRLRVLSDAIGTQGLIERLHRSDLDLAIVAGPLPGGTRADERVIEELAAGDLVCIVRRDDPLAEGRSVRLDQIAERRWVEAPPGQVNRFTTDAAFAAARLQRTVALEIGNSAEVPDYVAAGIGVAVVSDYVVRTRDDLVALPISGAKLRWSIGIARLRERDSAVMQALWNELVETVRIQPLQQPSG
ncbi:LysR family transcriptional regulator [Diaminobutyricimonas sp. TR449]|uniref:LysR family transcriptional regulator n=1 Tax=Diaminobutyricimonas sp. TR449 TaxID=2708076 RepID=UPI00141DBD06|nr:LysR family transcriptional regulator [Diaminobutyricimonas sp. TR449]